MVKLRLDSAFGIDETYSRKYISTHRAAQLRGPAWLVAVLVLTVIMTGDTAVRLLSVYCS